MEVFHELQHILTTIIAVMAALTGMGFVFNILLKPLKENQARIEKRIDKLEARMDQFEARLDQLEARMGRLESKLDQLLAQKNS